MVLLPSEQKNGAIVPRLLSALVLAPPVLIAIHLGSPWLDIVVGIAGILMAWEWGRICSNGEFGFPGWLAIVGVVGTTAAMFMEAPPLALLCVLTSAGVASWLLCTRYQGSALTLVIGIVLISAFPVSVLWIRGFPEMGRVIMIWLVLAVWFSDSGGYFFGRTIGGVKLAPRVSPNKTWAGFFGGVFLASIWSVFWLTGSSYTYYVWGLAAGIGVAILAQLGDLLASAAKRQYEVKDTSGIIPGHGGVIDRLDSMLLTAPIVAIVLLVVERFGI